LAAAIAVLVLCPVGCTEPEVEPVQIQIATGSRTGVYYVFGQSLATIINREVPGVRASVMVTTASAENLELVSNGSAQLGFTQADILPAVSGDRHPVSAVARVYDDLLHLVSRADGPIRQLEDLRGSRLSVGAPGSGTAITANRLLAVAQLAEGAVVTRQLGLDASVAALRTGEIDAFFFSGGLHVKAIEQLAADVPTRLVDLARWTEPLRRGYSEVYFARDIPSSVYGLDGISTVANPNFLIVGSSVPEALVYTLTRLLMDFRDELSAAHPAAGRLNRQSAIATLPLPLHPGAARYYRDTKP
jgi:TRAP transporter TAXI family solute receptor